ncbi:MepB family protein [Streptomyces venezuelae]|uniref:MepB family protein n=1 Tax=Streptomyces venezuelae TaxID=54571 RepID=UPI00343F1FAE
MRVRYREARTTPTKAGQFVFPLEALRAQGVVSTGGSGGKRAFRVCPPWVTTANRQAEKAQSWQVEFFLPSHGTVDPARARALYLWTAQ